MYADSAVLYMLNNRDDRRPGAAVLATQGRRPAERRRHGYGDAAPGEIDRQWRSAGFAGPIPNPPSCRDPASSIGASYGKVPLSAVPGAIRADYSTLSERGQHLAPVTTGKAFGDQPALAVAYRQRRAAAAMHRAAAAPPSTAAVRAAERCGNLGRGHGFAVIRTLPLMRGVASLRAAARPAAGSCRE